MSTASSPLSLAEIKPKMEFHGTVKRVELGGAVVDIGYEREAFLHISQIKGKKVKNVQDALSQGQEITVWVQNVDQATGYVSLTMIKPTAVSWSDVSEGQVYSGKVVRIEKFGAFVDIGAERPGLVHISEMADDYVGSPEDIVAKGQEVQVKVLRMNREKGQIDLSMKVAAAPVEVTTEVEEEVPTALALALQKARQSGDSANDDRDVPAGPKRQKKAKLDEILRRTLELQDKQ